MEHQATDHTGQSPVRNVWGYCHLEAEHSNVVLEAHRAQHLADIKADGFPLKWLKTPFGERQANTSSKGARGSVGQQCSDDQSSSIEGDCGFSSPL